MYYTEIFDLVITLTDINELYSIPKNSENRKTEIDDYILNKIKNKYDGRCLNDYFIKNINKILYRSPLKCNGLRLDKSEYNIDLQVEADILLLQKGDIVTNSIIVQILMNKYIICKRDNILSYIEYNNDLNFLNKGDIIPIIVSHSEYSLYQSEIAVKALPFIPIIPVTKYYKTNNIDNDSMIFLNKLIEKIKNILDFKDELKQWDYFEKLLYPYKIVDNNKANNLIEIIEKNKNKEIDLSNRIIFQNIKNNYSIDFYDNKKENKEIYPIIEDAKNIFVIFLNDYFRHLLTIKELSEIYDTDDKIKKNKKIFDFYTERKQ
jgi:hypothetical protein